MTSYGEGGTIRHGVNPVLEAEADKLIHDSLVGVTSIEAKKDILTPWKQKDRLDREVFSRDGVPDEASRRGMYHRAWNPGMPHLNSRDGVVRANRFSSGSRYADEDTLGGLGEALGAAGLD